MSTSDEPPYPFQLVGIETGEVAGHEDEQQSTRNLEGFSSYEPSERAAARIADALGRRASAPRIGSTRVEALVFTRNPSIGTAPFALFLALAASASIQAAPPEMAEVETRVAAFAVAFRDADTAALRGMLTPRYVHTNAGSSPLSRDRWLDYVSSRKEELASGQLRVTRYENQNLAIVLHGTTAVVTGVNFSEGVREGTPFSRRLRFTQVWVKDDGTWLRAAFHDAEVSP